MSRFRMYSSPSSTAGAMWSVGATVFIITVASFARAPLLPEIGSEFSLGATQLGLLTALFAAGRLVADLPVGRLTDEIPTRRMLGTSSVIVVGASLLFAGAPIAAVIYIAAFLGGVGSSWTNTTGMAFFATATSGRRRGTSLSLFATALLAGQAFGPAFGGAIESLGSWRWSFVAAGLLAGLGLIAVRAAPTSGSEGRETNRRSDEEAAIPRRVAAVLYALPALQFAIGGALIQTLFPIIGDAELGLSVRTIGLGLAVGGVARVLGALAAGRASDELGRRWALISGLAVQAIGITIGALDPTFGTWLTAIGLASLGSVGVSVGATVLGDLTGSGRLGKRLGVFRFAGDAGFVVGPLVAGLLYDALGRAGALLPMAAATAVLMIAAALILPETRPGPSRRQVMEEGRS
ncbi:MAG: MFS transporter [Acidimicrobiia bacterium]